MIHHYKPEARRYAHAFLNCYQQHLSPRYIAQFTSLAHFLQKNRWTYACLTISKVNDETRRAAIEKICQITDCPEYIEKLIYLLLSHKKIILLDSILYQIEQLYNVRIKKELFTVTTAHPLEEIEKKAITEHLQKKVSSNSVAQFTVDASLINGIKIQSPTLLWEHSVKKILRSINLFMSQRITS